MFISLCLSIHLHALFMLIWTNILPLSSSLLHIVLDRKKKNTNFKLPPSSWLVMVSVGPSNPQQS